MKAENYMQSVTVEDFYALVSRLSQQLRLPVTVLDIASTGASQVLDNGLLQLASITVAPSGSVSLHSTLVNPEVPVTAGSPKARGIRAQDVLASPKFPMVYDHLTRWFASSLIVGFNSTDDVIPVIYGNKVRYGLPIMSARHHLDLASVWTALGNSPAELAEVAAAYSIPSSNGSRPAANVQTIARTLEAMLWRHGSEAVIAKIIEVSSSYLTPEDVLTTDQRQPSKSVKTSGRGKSEWPPKKTPAPWAADLEAAITKTITTHGAVRPSHMAEIAEAMGWQETKASIEIGRLISRGKLKTAPFEIQDDQQLLSLHLPVLLKGSEDVKLKELREAIKSLTDHDLDYIQIRIGLVKLGVQLK